MSRPKELDRSVIRGLSVENSIRLIGIALDRATAVQMESIDALYRPNGDDRTLTLHGFT